MNYELIGIGYVTHIKSGKDCYRKIYENNGRYFYRVNGTFYELETDTFGFYDHR